MGENDVTQVPSPEEQDVTESSPDVVEEEQQLEEPTSQEGVVEEEKVPYSRLEKVSQRNQELERQNAYLQGQSERPQVIQPETDPYAGITDPQTKVFYQDLDKRIEKKAMKIAEAEKAGILRQNEILTRQMASLQHKMFKEDNTDVKEGSQEEARIAQLVRTGAIGLDEATWAVMGPKRAGTTQRVTQAKQQKKVEMKAKANLATQTSIPASNGLPKGKEAFREKMNILMQDWNGNLS